MKFHYYFNGEIITEQDHPRLAAPQPGYRITFVGRDPNKTNLPAKAEHFVVQGVDYTQKIPRLILVLDTHL